MDCISIPRVQEDWFNSGSQLASSAPTSSPLCSVMGRRAASFPVVNHQLPLMSPFPTMRSQSESAVLNRLGLANPRTLIINQLKRPETCSDVLSVPDGFTTHKCETMPESESFSEEDASTDTSSIADESEESDDTCTSPSGVDSSDTTKSSERRKCVRFADTCGKPLETIRVMKEPSDYPPTLDPAVLRRVLGDYYKGEDEEQKPASTWVMSFKQPASEYVKFHETLEHLNIALENVVLRNEISRMNGTIKVKNIAFEKKVFVRITSDNWKTHTDQAAIFLPSSSKTTDTFSFDFEVAPSGEDVNARIEFCVCFQAGPFNGNSPTLEYWDSNGGKNYCLINHEEAVTGTALPTRRYPLFGKPDKTDVYLYGSYDNWSTFSSWKDASSDVPYW